jgi:hypothetical protein
MGMDAMPLPSVTHEERKALSTPEILLLVRTLLL